VEGHPHLGYEDDLPLIALGRSTERRSYRPDDGPLTPLHSGCGLRFRPRLPVVNGCARTARKTFVAGSLFHGDGPRGCRWPPCRRQDCRPVAAEAADGGSNLRSWPDVKVAFDCCQHGVLVLASALLRLASHARMVVLNFNLPLDSAGSGAIRQQPMFQEVCPSAAGESGCSSVLARESVCTSRAT